MIIIPHPPWSLFGGGWDGRGGALPYLRDLNPKPLKSENHRPFVWVLCYVFVLRQILGVQDNVQSPPASEESTHPRGSGDEPLVQEGLSHTLRPRMGPKALV